MRTLSEWLIHLIVSALLNPTCPDVGHHPDDLAPLLELVDRNPFPERILIAEVTPRQSLVDDGDARGIRAIFCGKTAPPKQPGAKGREVVRCDSIVATIWHLTLRNRRSTLQIEGESPAREEWERLSDRG